jgi:hypothetical protein
LRLLIIAARSNLLTVGSIQPKEKVNMKKSRVVTWVAQTLSNDIESKVLATRSTWRKTLRHLVIAGFHYAARAAAMREGHSWDPRLPVETHAARPSLDLVPADVQVTKRPLGNLSGVLCVDAND